MRSTRGIGKHYTCEVSSSMAVSLNKNVATVPVDVEYLLITASIILSISKGLSL
ncbi:hypothetical protein ACFQZ1_08755 [Bacillus sp. CGMCC 1.60114]